MHAETSEKIKLLRNIKEVIFQALGRLKTMWIAIWTSARQIRL